MKDWLHIDWNEFHFLRPELLWLFAPVVVLLVLSILRTKEDIRWKQVIAPHLRSFMIRKGSESFQRIMQILIILVLSVAILGAAGPSWKMTELPEKKLETPVVIALDLSQSMLAEDIQPNRLEHAKFKIKDLLDQDPKARIALLGFAGSAHTIVPLTRDYRLINAHLEGLSPSTLPIPGSDLYTALDSTRKLLDSSSVKSTLILFSDDFSDDSFRLLNDFAASGNRRVEVFAVNTPSGASIPVRNGRGFIKNDQGEELISSLNSSVLHKLNSIENIHVNPMTLDNSDMERLATTIRDNLEFSEENEDVENQWQDEGYWLMIPLAFFVLIWFRKGWVIYSLMGLMTLSSCSEKERSFSDLWLSRDYQGQQLEDKWKYKEAAQTYHDPLRKGIAYYKAGDYEEAIEAFQQDTTSMGAYNLGLSYYKNGDIAAAEMAFGKAVALDPQNDAAKLSQQATQQILEGESEASPEEAQEASKEKPTAENKQNKSPEDLSGGGQEATKKDMEKKRLEETVNTDVRKGKELDEVPDDFEAGSKDNSQKVLMRKVDDDPSLFLQRKFSYQAKKKGLKPAKNLKQW